VFRSVDALWESYRSLSPYHYAANNPLRFSDPSGLYVKITGEDSDRAFSKLQGKVSFNMSIENGLISVNDDVVGENEAEEYLLSAIRDRNITVQLTATRSHFIDADNRTPIRIGMYNGSVIKDDGTIEASQFINMIQARKLEIVADVPQGFSVLHELNEAYYGALHLPGQGYTENNFNTAHNATVAIDPPQNTNYTIFDGDNRRGMGYMGIINNATRLKILLFWINQSTRQVMEADDETR
jgi:hypothetical protein